MVLGELYLPFFFREDKRNIGGHKKREMYWGTAGARNKHSCPQYDSFIGRRGSNGELLEML
jgi:hypothetical protein